MLKLPSILTKRLPIVITLGALTTFFLIHHTMPAEGRIIKTVDKDGNVSFHNRPGVTKEKPAGWQDLSSKFDGLILNIADTQGIDPYLIKCIIKVESDFNPDAVSVAGAMGLMQLMDDTARMYGCTEPFDPEMNIRTGTRHFKGLMNYFKQDIPLSLAAYHAGLGRVKKKMCIPPIKSTINYVNSIMYLYNGKKDFGAVVRKLYSKIQKDGTVLLYTK